MSGSKCDSCGIVISEVLAFIQCKLEVMDQISLTQLCLSAFTSDDITDAKNLLFECVKSEKKRTQRKREGKTQRDLEDIIGMFRELEPSEFPVFVVRNINKLPAIHFDHIDVTKLLKDLLILQRDVQHIKQNYATHEEIDCIKVDLQNVKTASIVNNFEMKNVNTRRRGVSKIMEDIDTHHSGPIGLLHIPGPEITITKESELQTPQPMLGSQDESSPTLVIEQTYRPVSQDTPKYSSPIDVRKPTRPRPSTSGSKRPSASKRGVANDPSSKRKSFAQLVSEKGEWKDKEHSEEWKTVQRRRYRNRLETSKGQAILEPESKFRAADLKVPLFINNVDKGTTAEDISKYILHKTQIVVCLEKIKPKYARDYDAYKVLVPGSKLSVFLDANLWPDGIAFRRFVSFYKHDAEESRYPTKQ